MCKNVVFGFDQLIFIALPSPSHSESELILPYYNICIDGFLMPLMYLASPQPSPSERGLTPSERGLILPYYNVCVKMWCLGLARKVD